MKNFNVKRSTVFTLLLILTLNMVLTISMIPKANAQTTYTLSLTVEENGLAGVNLNKVWAGGWGSLETVVYGPDTVSWEVAGDCQVSIYPSPDSGYWSFSNKDGGSWTYVSLNFNMQNAAHSVTVNFYPIQIVLTVSSPIQGASYDLGTGCTVSMSAKSYGSPLSYLTYAIRKNNVSGTKVASGSYSSPFTFNPASADTYYLIASAGNEYGCYDEKTVSFTIQEMTTYTITPYHDAGCTITPSTAQIVEEGGSKAFTYSANEGYNVSSVKVDGEEVINNGSYTFTNVLANHNISVTSTEKIRYSNLAVSDTAANKSVTFSSYWTDETAPLVNYTFSTNNTGTWTNDTASAFSGTPAWANVSKTLNSTIGQIVSYQWFAVDSAGNWNSTAIQTLTTTGYNIIASNDLNSLLDPNGTITVCHGANQQFDFSALDGYTILKVIINGETEASTTSPYIFTNITSSQTISISTSDQIWYVNATSDTGCTVDPNGLQMIPAGTNASFTFSANIGYQLYKLYINGTETPSTNPYVFEPTGNTTLYITSLEIATGQPAAPGGGPVYQPPTTSEFPIPTPEVPPENIQFGILIIVGILLASYGLYSVDKKSKNKTWSKNKDIKSGEKWKKKK